MVFEELEVEIGADTADFTAGVKSAENSLEGFDTQSLQTAASLQILQNRADEAEDEISSAGTSATTSSLSFTQLSSAATGSSVSLSGLSSTLLVAVIPALLATSTALIPVVTALGGLATILGAIGFVGLVGGLGAVATNGEELQGTFDEIQSTLETELQPLFDEFTEVLNTVGEAFIDIIPSLTPTEDQISQIGEGFEELGLALVDAIPPLVELATTLTTEFLPSLTDIISGVAESLPSFLETLVSTFRDLSDELSSAANFAVELAPELLDMGFAMFDVVEPAVSALADTLVTAVQEFNDLDTSMQGTIATVGSVAPVLVGLVSIVGGPITVALAAGVAAVVLFNDEISALADTVTDLASNALDTLTSTISNLDFSGLSQSVVNLEADFTSFIRYLSTQADVVLGQLQTVFAQNEATITTFGQSVVDAFAGFVDVLGTALTVAQEAIDVVVMPIIEDLIDTLGNQLGPTLTTISDGIDTWSSELDALGSDLTELFNQNEDVIMPSLRLLADVVGIFVVNSFDLLISTVRIIIELLSGDVGDALDIAANLFERFTERSNQFIAEWGIVEAINTAVDDMVSAIDTFFLTTLPQLAILGLARYVGIVQSQLTQVENIFIAAFNGIISGVADQMTELVNETIIDPLNGLVETINGVIDALPDDVQDQLPEGVSDIGTLDELESPDVSDVTLSQQEVDVEAAQQQAAQELVATLNIDVSGDGPLAEFVDQQASLTVEEQSRRSSRNTGGANGV